MINKGRRHELKMLKFKKRISQLGLTFTKGNFYAYRSHGKPCSCSICSPAKFEKHSTKYSDRRKELTTDWK